MLRPNGATNGQSAVPPYLSSAPAPLLMGSVTPSPNPSPRLSPVPSPSHNAGASGVLAPLTPNTLLQLQAILFAGSTASGNQQQLAQQLQQLQTLQQLQHLHQQQQQHTQGAGGGGGGQSPVAPLSNSSISSGGTTASTTPFTPSTGGSAAAGAGAGANGGAPNGNISIPLFTVSPAGTPMHGTSPLVSPSHAIQLNPVAIALLNYQAQQNMMAQQQTQTANGQSQSQSQINATNQPPQIGNLFAALAAAGNGTAQSPTMAENNGQPLQPGAPRFDFGQSANTPNGSGQNQPVSTLSAFGTAPFGFGMKPEPTANSNPFQSAQLKPPQHQNAPSALHAPMSPASPVSPASPNAAARADQVVAGVRRLSLHDKKPGRKVARGGKMKADPSRARAKAALGSSQVPASSLRVASASPPPGGMRSAAFGSDHDTEGEDEDDGSDADLFNPPTSSNANSAAITTAAAIAASQVGTTGTGNTTFQMNSLPLPGATFGSSLPPLYPGQSAAGGNTKPPAFTTNAFAQALSMAQAHSGPNSAPSGQTFSTATGFGLGGGGGGGGAAPLQSAFNLQPNMGSNSSIGGMQPTALAQAWRSGSLSAGNSPRDQSDVVSGHSSGGSSATNSPGRSGTGAGAGKKKRTRTAAGGGYFKSMIECGHIDPTTGKRQMYEQSTFFGKEVELYSAVLDPQARPLYRASSLADKFGCATNKVGMYLARRRNVQDGIFQATGFQRKPAGRTGLKAGGYFLSLVACKAFEQHFREQSRKRSKKPPGAAGSPSVAGMAGGASPDDLLLDDDDLLDGEDGGDDNELDDGGESGGAESKNPFGSGAAVAGSGSGAVAGPTGGRAPSGQPPTKRRNSNSGGMSEASAMAAASAAAGGGGGSTVGVTRVIVNQPQRMSPNPSQQMYHQSMMVQPTSDVHRSPSPYHQVPNAPTTTVNGLPLPPLEAMDQSGGGPKHRKLASDDFASLVNPLVSPSMRLGASGSGMSNASPSGGSAANSFSFGGGLITPTAAAGPTTGSGLPLPPLNTASLMSSEQQHLVSLQLQQQQREAELQQSLQRQQPLLQPPPALPPAADTESMFGPTSNDVSSLGFGIAPTMIEPSQTGSSLGFGIPASNHGGSNSGRRMNQTPSGTGTAQSRAFDAQMEMSRRLREMSLSQLGIKPNPGGRGGGGFLTDGTGGGGGGMGGGGAHNSSLTVSPLGSPMNGSPLDGISPRLDMRRFDPPNGSNGASPAMLTTSLPHGSGTNSSHMIMTLGATSDGAFTPPFGLSPNATPLVDSRELSGTPALVSPLAAAAAAAANSGTHQPHSLSSHATSSHFAGVAGGGGNIASITAAAAAAATAAGAQSQSSNSVYRPLQPSPTQQRRQQVLPMQPPQLPTAGGGPNSGGSNSGSSSGSSHTRSLSGDVQMMFNLSPITSPDVTPMFGQRRIDEPASAFAGVVIPSSHATVSMHATSTKNAPTPGNQS